MKRIQQISALTVLLATCICACATTPAGNESAQPDVAAAQPTANLVQSVAVSSLFAHKLLLPTPSGPLDLSVAQGANLSLDELLRRLSKVSGVTFSPSAPVAERLRNASVSLSQDKRITAAEVYPWIESILQQNGFTLAVLEGGSAPLVGVYSNSVPGQNAPAFNLEADQVAECRAHPAFLFTVVLTLPHTDVRSLGNSLRILSPDTQSGGVIPVGTTNSIILTGNGRQVADLAAMLVTIDERAAQSAAAPKSP